MTDLDRTFTVASDDALVALILAAHERLVIVAPALTKPVAEAVARRLGERGPLIVTLILDSDPEVYRLGFGDQEALTIIRDASAANLIDLREQAGVRIGVVIADETTLIYAPVSRNIEAGSTSVDKPNAIVLGGPATTRIAAAAGADHSDETRSAEIGRAALEPAKVEAMQADLKASPPVPYDLTRRLNVFSSKVQYVEFSASNYLLTRRQLALPPDLVDVSDEDLRKSISSKIRAPFAGVGKVEVKLGDEDKGETLQIDDTWLKGERKRIEDEYTFQINNFGRVILYTDQARFDAAAERFKLIVEAYQRALSDKLQAAHADFEQRILAEFAPRWAQKPPKYFTRWDIKPSAEAIEGRLKALAGDLFEQALCFQPPVVTTLRKGVSPENVRDRKFLTALKDIMRKRQVPRAIIDSLFETGQAAPKTGSFL